MTVIIDHLARGRLPPKTVTPPSPTEIADALSKHPRTLWAVLRELYQRDERIVGPWTMRNPRTDPVDSPPESRLTVHRFDPWHHAVVTVRCGDVKGLFNIYGRPAMLGTPLVSPDSPIGLPQYKTKLEAQTAADQWLRDHGWTLCDPKEGE